MFSFIKKLFGFDTPVAAPAAPVVESKVEAVNAAPYKVEAPVAAIKASKPAAKKPAAKKPAAKPAAKKPAAPKKPRPPKAKAKTVTTK